MPYLGNIPATQFAELKYQDFTGGTGTSFTLNDPVGSAQELEVFVNNVRQEPGVAYTVSGTTLTMTGSIVASDDFYVVFQGKSTGTATHPAGQALTATTGTFTGAVTLSGGVSGDVAFDTDTLFVDESTNRVGIGTTSPDTSLHISAASSARLRLEDTTNNVKADILVGNTSSVIGNASNHDLAFMTNDANRMTIDSSGIAKFSSANNVGRIMTSGNVSIADDSSITLTNATAGAVIAMIYDTSSGSGASVFFSYEGSPEIIKQSASNYVIGDTDNFFCIIKNANSHTATFKNRSGVSRTFHIFLIGGDVRP